jgi:predicted nicotinamide N-methyase
MKLLIWEDGFKKLVDLNQEDVTDRWTLHSAVELQVTLANVTVKLEQQPHALNATRMGVGACVWEGELFLAAYLAHLPTHRYIGQRVIELGAGPGLAGILLAKLGARALVSDIKKVLPLVERNLEINEVSFSQKRGAVSGMAEAIELEWGAPGYRERVDLIVSEPVDWILAADCCYIDNEGTSPSTRHFIWTCHRLFSSPTTRCLVSFELRSQQIKETFLEESNKAFDHVRRVQPKDLPRSCQQAHHIELYELSGPKTGYVLCDGEDLS